MKRIVYHTLIRDRIPEIIEADGGEPVVTVLNEESFINAAKQKILEEGEELKRASDPDEVAGELVDILELVDAIAGAYGIRRSSLTALQNRKRTKRGGFEQRLFLEEVRE